MATRWMKWNEGTHIFEYSTDGVTFNPLPLNASILTEGTINAARLPATLPSTGGNNVWTGVNTITHVSPSLNFVESDAPVDAKRWAMYVDSQVFRLTTTTDAGAGITQVLAITRAGGIASVSTEGHSFTVNSTGNGGIAIINANAGTNAAADIQFHSVWGMLGTIKLHGGNHSVAPNRMDINKTGAGNLRMNAQDTTIELATGNVVRLSIGTDGNVTATGNLFSYGYLYANAGMVEYGRPYIAGDWQNIAQNASNFWANSGTFTLTAQTAYKYAVYGRTLYLEAIIQGTNSAITNWVNINLPVTVKTPSPNSICLGYSTSGWQSCFTQVQTTFIQVFGTIGGGNWPVGTCMIHVRLAFSLN